MTRDTSRADSRARGAGGGDARDLRAGTDLSDGLARLRRARRSKGAPLPRGARYGGGVAEPLPIRVRFRAEWEEVVVGGLPAVGSRLERFGREWVMVDRREPRKFEDFRVELREPGLGPPRGPDDIPPERG